MGYNQHQMYRVAVAVVGLMVASSALGCRERSPAPAASVSAGRGLRTVTAERDASAEPVAPSAPNDPKHAHQVLQAVSPPEGARTTMPARSEREGMQYAMSWCVPAATAREAIGLVAERLGASGVRDIEIRGVDPRYALAGTRGGFRVNAIVEPDASTSCPRTHAGWPLRLTAFSDDAARVPLLPAPGPGERVDGF